MVVDSNLKQILFFVISGVLLGLSVNTLGSIPLSILAWIAFIPMFMALKSEFNWRHFFIATYLFSFVKLTLGLFSFVTVHTIPGLILILLGSLIYSVPLWIHFSIQRKIGWRNSLLILPFLWTAYITVVSDGILAMPILSFSPSQAALPWLIQFIDVTGHTAILFWLLMLNVLLTLSIESWTQYKSKIESRSSEIGYLTKRVGIVIVGMFAIPILYTLYSYQTLPNTFTDEITVGLVQPGFADEEPDFISELFDKQIELTDSLVANLEVDLIIWPESAIGIPLLEDSTVVEYVFQKVLSWETPLLAGTFDREFYNPGESIPNLQQYLGRDFEVFNAAIMITPQLAWMHLQEDLPLNSVKMYHKTSLMPFTEYVPLSETFPVLSRASVYSGDFSHYSKGESLEYLTFAAKNQDIFNVSPMICWDLLSTRSSKLAVDTGSQFIAALTNESALGDQFRVTVYEMESYTRLRSIESRRSIAKASLTGYTFFTNPFGQVYGLVPWWSPQISVGSMALTDFKSIYARYPNAYTILNILGLVVLLIHFLTQDHKTHQKQKPKAKPKSRSKA